MTDGPLTRVVLRRRYQRRRDRILFGAPLQSRRTGPGEITLWLPAGVVFCVVQWHGDDYGTRRWRLFIARAGRPGDALTRLPGVIPGAEALADFTCVDAVRRALRALERGGVRLDDVPVAYWRRFQERVSQRRVLLPPSRAEIRAAALRRAVRP